MLYLETGLKSLFADTLKLHFKYINRALLLPANKLPSIIAKKIISNDTYWSDEWSKLRNMINVNPDNYRPLSKHWKTRLLDY